MSTQIAALRGLLFGGGKGEIAERFADAAKGKIPLVVNAQSADVIASLLLLKSEVDSQTGHNLRLVVSGAAEAHLLAAELGAAGVGVLMGQRLYPGAWEQRRFLPGPPLTAESAIATLAKNNVTVGVITVGIMDAYASLVRNTRFDLAWVRAVSIPSI